MGEQTTHPYDVFISYSHADREWVKGWLLPRLEAESLHVCIDYRDFDVGVPSLVNIERAVDNSRRTLLVLTPAWVESAWTEFESLLTQTADPAARQRRLLPLVLQICQPPRRIAILTYADFTQPDEWEAQLPRLVKAIRGQMNLRDLGPSLSQLLGPGAAPFFVPFPHNPDFVGRDVELAKLHELLQAGQGPVDIRPTVLVDLGELQARTEAELAQLGRPYLREQFKVSRESPELVRTLQGHSAVVSDVALSADGRLAISASFDQTLKVWDVATGQAVSALPTNAPLYCCAVTPDGKTIVAGDSIGAVHFLE